MRLFASLLVLWATFLSVVYGYSLPGGYERVFFYYAYVAECKASSGNPSTIGKGCGRITQIKGCCNFDQFLSYILAKPVSIPLPRYAIAHQLKKKPVNIDQTPHPGLPDLEKTAQAVKANALD